MAFQDGLYCMELVFRQKLPMWNIFQSQVVDTNDNYNSHCFLLRFKVWQIIFCYFNT